MKVSFTCYPYFNKYLIVGLLFFCVFPPGVILAKSRNPVSGNNDKNVAVLILQQSDYIYDWPDLSYQDEMVETVVRALVGMDVDVYRHVNSTSLGMKRAIKDFFQKRKTGRDLLLVLYFGHTYPVQNKQSSLIPSDIPLPKKWNDRTKTQIIPLQELIYEALQGKEKTAIFINSSVSISQEAVGKYSETSSQNGSCLIMAAGRQGEAIPTESRFVEALIKELKSLRTTKKPKDVGALCKRVAGKGMHNSWICPWYTIIGSPATSGWILPKHSGKSDRRKKSFFAVQTLADDAVLRILNIKPKYKPDGPDGMELPPKVYEIEITQNGIKRQGSIRLLPGEHLYFSLPVKFSPSSGVAGKVSGNEPTGGEASLNGHEADENMSNGHKVAGDYGFTLIKVEHGVFVMGGDRFNERPKHPVIIRKDFYIMDREVPVRLYRRFLKETGKGGGFGHGNGPDFPAVNISWSEANEFADWLSKVSGKKFRLPTEAEWEYVAKKQNSIVDGAIFKKLVPVDQAVENQLGVRGMLGNVWEWCSDCWRQRYTQKKRHGDISSSGCMNRVIRGGSWRNNIRLISPSSRNGISYKTRAGNIGFRLITEE